jgi:murein DD-endopeptidase
MHLSKFLVSKGQTVTAGQVVANTGSTSASSPHLHYEIARNGYSLGALQFPAAKTKDDFRARTYNPLKDYWQMRRR